MKTFFSEAFARFSPVRTASRRAKRNEFTPREPAVVRGPDLSGLSVLLVEDRPARDRILADALMILGAEVTLECSGRSAFTAATKRLWAGDAFDAVVFDLRQSPLEASITAGALHDAGYAGKVIALAGDPSRASAATWRRAHFTAVADRENAVAVLPTLLAS